MNPENKKQDGKVWPRTLWEIMAGMWNFCLNFGEALSHGEMHQAYTPQGQLYQLNKEFASVGCLPGQKKLKEPKMEMNS